MLSTLSRRLRVTLIASISAAAIGLPSLALAAPASAQDKQHDLAASLAELSATLSSVAEVADTLTEAPQTAPTADADYASELSGLEEFIESLTAPHDVGATADGRTVVFPAKGNFTSGFGMRGTSVHEGIDIANASGTPIRAVMDGTVIRTGPAPGYGNWVVLQHENGEKSVYGHMADWDVSVGERVSAGDKIAEIGNEGRSTGPHLHFEILADGHTPTDPVRWFADQGISVTSASR